MWACFSFVNQHLVRRDADNELLGHSYWCCCCARCDLHSARPSWLVDAFVGSAEVWGKTARSVKKAKFASDVKVPLPHQQFANVQNNAANQASFVERWWCRQRKILGQWKEVTNQKRTSCRPGNIQIGKLRVCEKVCKNQLQLGYYWPCLVVSRDKHREM